MDGISERHSTPIEYWVESRKSARRKLVLSSLLLIFAWVFPDQLTNLEVFGQTFGLPLRWILLITTIPYAYHLWHFTQVEQATETKDYGNEVAKWRYHRIKKYGSRKFDIKAAFKDRLKYHKDRDEEFQVEYRTADGQLKCRDARGDDLNRRLSKVTPDGCHPKLRGVWTVELTVTAVYGTKIGMGYTYVQFQSTETVDEREVWFLLPISHMRAMVNSPDFWDAKFPYVIAIVPAAILAIDFFRLSVALASILYL